MTIATTTLQQVTGIVGRRTAENVTKAGLEFDGRWRVSERTIDGEGKR
jgi:hypothetical protein